MAKNKGGRPIIMTEEKIRQFKAICRMKPSLEDCCSFLDCGQDTIIRYCKSIGESFASFRDKNMVHTRFGLIRKAIQKAENGDNTMLIFCLKNLCGWADRQEIEHKGEDINPVNIYLPQNARD
jgi:hypothetical protein